MKGFQKEGETSKAPRYQKKGLTWPCEGCQVRPFLLRPDSQLPVAGKVRRRILALLCENRGTSGSLRRRPFAGVRRRSSRACRTSGRNALRVPIGYQSHRV